MPEIFWIAQLCDADFRSVAAAHAPRLIEAFRRYTLEQAEQAFRQQLEGRKEVRRIA